MYVKHIQLGHGVALEIEYTNTSTEKRFRDIRDLTPTMIPMKLLVKHFCIMYRLCSEYFVVHTYRSQCLRWVEGGFVVHTYDTPTQTLVYFGLIYTGDINHLSTWTCLNDVPVITTWNHVEVLTPHGEFAPCCYRTNKSCLMASNPANINPYRRSNCINKDLHPHPRIACLHYSVSIHLPQLGSILK